ncbi:hypothetical protein FDO65_21145 [Nakamurella flava]|uniref:Cell division protein FtsL n=1 Tax=Nakamurella flava TaxID=2576308 RepID=A0A4U6Q654_9ACTN|nr:hypothetical protein [Nakamurella flava]TKV56093.1 hypothetical protein FDO65_21145 [Nakamurella flava]
MTIQDEVRTAGPDTGRRARSGRSSTESSRRAYERRQRRLQKSGETRLGSPGRPVAAALDRAPFVIAVIVLLTAGVAGVLYLNTLTDEAGMKAAKARTDSASLRLDIEALQREVAGLDSTPRIAQVAAQLGLTIAGDSAMLEIDGAGHGTVVGTPSAVPTPAPAAAAPTTDPAAAGAAATPATTPAPAPAAEAAPTTAAPTTAAPEAAAPEAAAPAAPAPVTAAPSAVTATGTVG